MTTSDPPPSERAVQKILYAPTTSQMRHKFTFHQHGQLAHLNTILLNYSHPRRQEKTVADTLDSTQEHTVIIDDTNDGEDDAFRLLNFRDVAYGTTTASATSDIAAVEMYKTHLNYNDNARDTGEHDAETKRERELERARKILNEYVAALRLSKTTSHSQKASAEASHNVPPSSQQNHNTARITDADGSPKHPATNEGSNPGTHSHRRTDSGAEGTLQQLRKRSLPLTLRHNVPKSQP
jgi:hypothetical protein